SETTPALVMREPKTDTTSVARASVHAANHCVPDRPIAGVLSDRVAADTVMLLVVATSVLDTSAPNTSKLVVANVRLSCHVTKHAPVVWHDPSGSDCVAAELLSTAPVASRTAPVGSTREPQTSVRLL